MNNEFAIHDHQLSHRLQDCFEQISNFLKNNPLLTRQETSSFIPEGPLTLQTGTKITTCGVSLHIDLLYPDLNNKNRYAMREKIHLHPECFKTVSTILDREACFTFFENFKLLQQQMHAFEKNIFSAEILNKYTFQLLLIKYSLSTLDYDSSLHEFGSRIFGNIHEDDTLYSFHLGETNKELEIFDYDHHKWIPPRWENTSPLVLFGEQSRLSGILPTPHRLRVMSREKNKTRYSFIIERSPRDLHAFQKEFHTPELIRFENAKIREEQTAFLIWDELPNGQKADEEILKLTEDFIKLHLFFFIRGDESKIIRYKPQDSIFNQLERKKIRYVVCIQPGFLLKCENSVEALLVGALQQPEKYFIHHYHQRLREGICLATIDKKKSEGIDHWLQSFHLKDVSNELPHLILPESKDTFFSHTIVRPHTPLADEIQTQKKEIDRHLKDGFSTTFVFNTEGYQQLSGLHFSKNTVQLVGFASGFKLNYLASLYKNNINKISFIDSNKNSIELKKQMLANWNGQDFPRWFFKYWNNQFPIYEKKPSFFQKRWQKELSLWGGEDAFLENWNWFKKQDVTFHHLDVISQVDSFSDILDSNQTTLFWASNLWHNEYVSFHFGLENLKTSYTKWLTSLNKINKNIVFIQDEIPTSTGWIWPNQKNITSLLDELT